MANRLNIMDIRSIRTQKIPLPVRPMARGLRGKGLSLLPRSQDRADHKGLPRRVDIRELLCWRFCPIASPYSKVELIHTRQTQIKFFWRRPGAAKLPDHGNFFLCG